MKVSCHAGEQSVCLITNYSREKGWLCTQHRNTGTRENQNWLEIRLPKLSFQFMHLYLTTNSSHSMKSQSPAGQNAAHFMLRNSPRPKGITKLARERGYCPHLIHRELQQGSTIVFLKTASAWALTGSILPSISLKIRAIGCEA